MRQPGQAHSQDFFGIFSPRKNPPKFLPLKPISLSAGLAGGDACPRPNLFTKREIFPSPCRKAMPDLFFIQAPQGRGGAGQGHNRRQI